MGKGKILKWGFAVVIILGTIVYYTLQKSVDGYDLMCPPEGLAKSEVDLVYGPPTKSDIIYDRKALPDIIVQEHCIYTLPNSLYCMAFYEQGKVKKSFLYSGATGPLTQGSNQVVNKMKMVQYKIKYKVKLEESISQTLPLYEKKVKAFRNKDLKPVDSKVFFTLAQINSPNKSSGAIEYGLFINSEGELFQNLKPLGISLKSYLMNYKSKGQLDIFIDSERKYEPEIIKLLSLNKINTVFVGYNSNLKRFGSCDLLKINALKQGGLENLKVLNVKLDGYNYELEGKKYTFSDIQRLLENMKMKDPNFRIVVSVSKNSNFQDVFTFFDIVPRKILVNVK